MTKAEKYPDSVEAILQREAKMLVRSVWEIYSYHVPTGYNIDVPINPEIYNMLNNQQKRYFYMLFGGVWNIIMPHERPGVWLCVPREYIQCFHYHTPLRVHPTRVYK